MNTPQLHGQRLHPVQETGNEKAESLLSVQQTPNEHSMMMIDSSRLVMDNGDSPVGSIEDIFTRLTRRLVFEFLGGHARMEELPCLEEVTNGNDEFHRTTISPTFSKSSQVKPLDVNENLHQLSAISMDLDIISRIMDYHCEDIENNECNQNPVRNVSVLLNTFDASFTEYSPPEHTSQRTDKIELLSENSINAHFICNKFVMDILNSDYPTTSLPFQQIDFPGNVFKVINLKFLDFFNFMDSNSDPDTLCKTLASKLQKISVNRTTGIQEDALINHHHESNSGNLKLHFHRHHNNLNDVPVSNRSSTSAWNNEPINDGNTFAIPNPGTLMDYLYGDLEIPRFLDAESSSMQPEDSCCTIGNNGEGPTLSVPAPSQLMNFLYGNLESPVFLSSELIEEEVPIYTEYDGNYSKVEVISRSADHTIEESPQCSAMNSSAILETIVGLMTKSLCDSNGFTNGMDLKRDRIPSNSQFGKDSSEVSDSKLCYHQDEFNIVADYFDKFTSKVHNALATEAIGRFHENPTTFVPTIIPLPYKSEDDKENMKTDPSPFTINTDETSLMDKNSTSNSDENPKVYDYPCLLGYYDSDDDAEVTDLSDCTLNDLFSCFNNTISFLIKSKNGSLAGAFEENKITPTSSALLKCNGEKIGSDSSFFDLSDHDELLEIYGISNQEQYTQTGYTCESPTWPGKSDGKIQKSQAFLTSNLTKNDNADGTLTADSSLFHSNTDETSAMNKKWTDEINKRNSEISVSPCYLNQMECAFETSFIPNYGSIDCVHSCNDDSGDSIEHQSLKNDKNELKFAFPDPSTLKDFFYGSLDSPQFLASELLDGKIDTHDYPSLFGDSDQNDRAEEADLSDRMIFDQCVYDVSSINKFSCSIQLLDVSSSSFDISDYDELLERYDIDNQDQFMNGDWTCDSPTWSGKI